MTTDTKTATPVTAPAQKRKYISWAALAMMTVGSVASLRAAPTMAVFGLASVFLYILPGIVFLIPTSLVSAELASGWKGGVFNWVSTAPVQDMLWARPAANVLGIDCPPVVGSTASIPAQARARVSLRVPPGMDAGKARAALIAHLRAATPWHAKADIEPGSKGQPFQASAGGPAYAAMSHALEQAYGRPTTTAGVGGSIPLCNVLKQTFPDAEIMLTGVEEPKCQMHAPNESVDPAEIQRLALAEALFLANYPI